jgi:hypothetical protein
VSVGIGQCRLGKASWRYGWSWTCAEQPVQAAFITGRVGYADKEANMKYSIFAVLIVAGAALAAGSGEARQA